MWLYNSKAVQGVNWCVPREQLYVRVIRNSEKGNIKGEYEREWETYINGIKRGNGEGQKNRKEKGRGTRKQKRKGK